MPLRTSAAALLLGTGCYAVVDPGQFRGSTDSPPPSVISVLPDQIHEGRGSASGSPPAVVTFVLDSAAQATPSVRSTDPKVRVDGVRLSEDGLRVGVALRAEVRPDLSEGASARFGLALDEGEPLALTLLGHDEAVFSGVVSTVPSQLSELTLAGARFVGDAPLRVTVWGQASLRGPLVDLSATSTRAGPGGCRPGDGCLADGEVGADANRGGGGGGSWVAEGGASGNVPGGVRAGVGDPSGAGGNGSSDGAALGGLGGASGGRWVLDARGRSVFDGRVRALGADGLDSPACDAGGGGGGAGGGIVLAASMPWSSPGLSVEVGGGAGGGGQGCGRRGGDGADGLAYLVGDPTLGPTVLSDPFYAPTVRLSGPPGQQISYRVGAGPTQSSTLDGEGFGQVSLTETGEFCLVEPILGSNVACVTRFVGGAP